jgi:hypothetical protein
MASDLVNEDNTVRNLSCIGSGDLEGDFVEGLKKVNQVAC